MHEISNNPGLSFLAFAVFIAVVSLGSSFSSDWLPAIGGIQKSYSQNELDKAITKATENVQKKLETAMTDLRQIEFENGILRRELTKHLRSDEPVGPLTVRDAKNCPPGWSVIDSGYFAKNGVGVSLPDGAHVCIINSHFQENGTGFQVR